MKKVPAKITIDLKTGASTAEYVEIIDEQYDKHFIQPFAKIFYDMIKRDIETGKFKPNECTKE